MSNQKSEAPNPVKSPAAPKAKSGNMSAGEAIRMRNDFYQDSAPKVVQAAAIAVVALLLAVGTAIYATLKKEQNVYFAVDEGNRIVPLQPLSSPNLSNAVVGQWLTESLAKTFDYHYSNYSDRLNESANTYFTSDGANSLIAAIQDSGLIDQVKKLEGKVALTLRPPILVQDGSLGAGQFYAWVFAVDGTLTIFTKSSRYDFPVKFEVTVSRRDELEYPKGVGIARLFMEINRNAK